MGSDERDSAVYAPFYAIQTHWGYFYGIKDVGEALQLAPKVNKRNESRGGVGHAAFFYGQMSAR